MRIRMQFKIGLQKLRLQIQQWVLRALVKDKPKSITIQLPLVDYWRAFEAHKANEAITCYGTLNVSPKSAQLLEPRNLEVIKSEGGIFDNT